MSQYDTCCGCGKVFISVHKLTCHVIKCTKIDILIKAEKAPRECAE